MPSFWRTPSALAEAGATDNHHERERQHIIQILDHTQWRIYGRNGAAAQLGLNPSTLRSRLKRLGLRRPTHPHLPKTAPPRSFTASRE